MDYELKTIYLIAPGKPIIEGNVIEYDYEFEDSVRAKISTVYGTYFVKLYNNDNMQKVFIRGILYSPYKSIGIAIDNTKLILDNLTEYQKGWRDIELELPVTMEQVVCRDAKRYYNTEGYFIDETFYNNYGYKTKDKFTQWKYLKEY